MGSSISDTRFNAIIMASLPASYRPVKQTISATERTSKSPMSPTDLMDFFTEEARNQYLEDQRANQAESALVAHGSKQKKGDHKGEKCENCGRMYHVKADCYHKGDGKEGQAPWMEKDKKEDKKGEDSANVAQEEEFFAFTCTSDLTAAAEALQIPKSKQGAIADRGASCHFCPDKSKFTNYRVLKNQHVTTADGRTFRALGMGDVKITLPNGANHSSDHAQFTSSKMSINEAHQKFGHIAHASIKHMVKTRMVMGIELDLDSKPKFCEPCAKAKSNCQPFPKESTTWATRYGEHVHWGLWGPATVQSLAGHLYVAAWMDDTTQEMKLYFQKKKSETITSYKKDEAYIRMQTGQGIKYSHPDHGGEFLSKELTERQDLQGTQCELTVHDSPQQNGVSKCGM